MPPKLTLENRDDIEKAWLKLPAPKYHVVSCENLLSNKELFSWYISTKHLFYHNYIWLKIVCDCPNCLENFVILCTSCNPVYERKRLCTNYQWLTQDFQNQIFENKRGLVFIPPPTPRYTARPIWMATST